MNHTTFSIGEEISYLEVKPITQKHIDYYANASGDNNSIHLNTEAAMRLGFPKPVVHGMWAMGLLNTLLHQSFSHAYHLVSMETSFTKPIFVGDHLYVSAKVQEMSGSQLTIKVTGLNQHDDTILKGNIVVIGGDK